MFTDSDWAGCRRTRKSTVGGAVLWGTAFLKSWAKTKPVIALSTDEAELGSVVRAATEALGLQSALGDRERGIAIALSAGTFLYVCLCELLPEVFHRREDGLLKVVLLAAGIALMATVQGLTH